MKKIISLIKTYLFGSIVIASSVTSIGVVLLLTIRISAYTQESMLAIKENDISKQEGKVENLTIAVDVSGAVRNPGLITIKNGSRLSEALEKAGGVDKTVDQNYLNHSINLSQLLVDEQKIYIPHEGERDKQLMEQGIDDGENTTDVLNLVNINKASKSTLEKLPGIGEVIAQKIIDGRPYETFEQLTERKVLGNSVLEKIQNSITL